MGVHTTFITSSEEYFKSFSKAFYESIWKSRGCPPGKSPCVQSYPQPWGLAGRKDPAAPVRGEGQGSWGSHGCKETPEPWEQGWAWRWREGPASWWEKERVPGRLVGSQVATACTPWHCAPEAPMATAAEIGFLEVQRGSVCSRGTLGGFWQARQSGWLCWS